MEHHLYTVEEAAQRLKLHVKTVRRKIREGALAATRVGHQYRITEAALAAFADLPVEAVPVSRAVTASTIVEVQAISPEEASRLSTHLTAALSGQRAGLHLACHYFEEAGRLSISISGPLADLPRVLEMVGTLVSR